MTAIKGTGPMDDVLAEAMADSNKGIGGVKDEAVRLVATLSRRQLHLERMVKWAEKILARYQEKLKQVAERDLPNALIEMGARAFTLTDGSKVEVSKIYTGSIKVENRFKAYAWLREHDHDALIKAEVVLDFAKGDVDRAEKLMAAIQAVLKKRKMEDDVKLELSQSIHWQTLRAFIREQIEAEEKAVSDGTPIPEADRLPRDLLGVYIIDKATVKPKT